METEIISPLPMPALLVVFSLHLYPESRGANLVPRVLSLSILESEKTLGTRLQRPLNRSRFTVTQQIRYKKNKLKTVQWKKPRKRSVAKD